MGTRIGVFKILKIEEDRESDTGAVLGGGDKKVWITMVENEKKKWWEIWYARIQEYRKVRERN